MKSDRMDDTCWKVWKWIHLIIQSRYIRKSPPPERVDEITLRVLASETSAQVAGMNTLFIQGGQRNVG